MRLFLMSYVLTPEPMSSGRHLDGLPAVLPTYNWSTFGIVFSSLQRGRDSPSSGFGRWSCPDTSWWLPFLVPHCDQIVNTEDNQQEATPYAWQERMYWVSFNCADLTACRRCSCPYSNDRYHDHQLYQSDSRNGCVSCCRCHSQHPTNTVNLSAFSAMSVIFSFLHIWVQRIWWGGWGDSTKSPAKAGLLTGWPMSGGFPTLIRPIQYWEERHDWPNDLQVMYSPHSCG